MAAGEAARALTMNDTRPAPGIPLREAVGTPESARTATHDRWTLGSDALSRVLNLADPPSRLPLSSLTHVGVPPTLRCAGCPAPASLPAHAEALTILDHKSPLAGGAGWGNPATGPATAISQECINEFPSQMFVSTPSSHLSQW
jgi:hypothetical protein